MVFNGDSSLLRIEEWLGRKSGLIGVIVLLGSFLLFCSTRTNLNGGDTRGITDLAWWVAEGHSPRLNGHPAYRGDGPWGYWAVKKDNGVIATVYPPGNLLFGATGFYLFRIMGIPVKVSEDGIYAKFIASAMIALACWCLWRVLATTAGHICALLCALFIATASPYYTSLSQALWSQTGGVLCQALSSMFYIKALPARNNVSSKLNDLWFLPAGFFTVWGIFSRPQFLIWAVLFFTFIALEHHKGVWKALAGGLIALVPGLFLQNYSTGSLLGNYVGKQTGFGMTLSPLDWLSHAIGLLFSFTRGIFLYCPWTLLIAGGLIMLGTKSRWKNRWLLLNALNMLGIFGLIVLFKGWYGGTDFGPRLISDTLFSGLIVASPLIALLCRKKTGLLLALILWFPGAYIHRNMMLNPSAMWDNFIPADKWHQSYYEWRSSAFRYYLLKGKTLRDLQNIVLEPTMTSNKISADDSTAERFLESGIKINKENKYFILLGRTASFLFHLPRNLENMNLWIVLDIESPYQRGFSRNISIRLNGKTVGNFSFVAGLESPTIRVCVPAEMFEKTKPNRLVIAEPSPPQHNHGNEVLTLKSITFIPESSARKTAGVPAE